MDPDYDIPPTPPVELDPQPQQGPQRTPAQRERFIRHIQVRQVEDDSDSERDRFMRHIRGEDDSDSSEDEPGG